MHANIVLADNERGYVISVYYRQNAGLELSYKALAQRFAES